MLLGRAIAVSDIEPMPWALGDSGMRMTPGSIDSIERALRAFSDPACRAKFGISARDRALGLFLAGSSVEAFQLAVQDAIEDFTPIK